MAHSFLVLDSESSVDVISRVRYLVSLAYEIVDIVQFLSANIR